MKAEPLILVEILVLAKGESDPSPTKTLAQKIDRLPELKNSPFCGNKFSWNEDMKQMKLLQDCDIIKEKMTLLQTVGRITDKTECIDSIDLHIDGVKMGRWYTGGKPLTGRKVTFDNMLPKENRRRQAKVNVTARNPNAKLSNFQITFNIDSSNCSGLVEVTNEDEEKTEKPGIQVEAEDEAGSPGSDKTLMIVVVLTIGFALAVIVASVICWKKNNNKRNVPDRRSVELNPIYGTYSRGWDGEGDYGEGDKVYVIDNNDYYTAS